jgi:uncharacterized protein (DUF2141 family)
MLSRKSACPSAALEPSLNRHQQTPIILLANNHLGATVMNRFTQIISAIAINLPALAAASANQPAALEVAFTGIETQTGNIMLAMFDSEQAYNGQGAPIRVSMVAANAAEAKTMIEGLPAGKYAIKSFHDIDGDGKMGTNPFGIPTEPFAFSNNAAGNMGPAKWADANFEISAGNNSHSIVIQ